MIEKVKKICIWLINVILAISKALRESKASLFAASTAFFAFLSLIPMLILVCSILPFIHGSQEMFLSVIDSVLPRSLEAFSTRIIEEIYDKSITLLTLFQMIFLIYPSLLALIWILLIKVFIEYNHVLPFLAAVGLFAAFLRTRIGGKPVGVICAVSPYTLGVYLLHENIGVRYVWQKWLGAERISNVAELIV